MAIFKNEFSWSKSRHDLFSDCERKYYFNYYGSWNGWKYNSDERTKEIYYLKKLQNRYMWIGSVVHQKIEKLLKSVRSGDVPATNEELKSSLLAELRDDFVTSRSGLWAKKKWLLFEHEYHMDIEDEEWKSIAQQAQDCFSNFLGSELYEEILKFEPDQWLEIEEFSSFYIEDVKIHVVLDFSFRKRDEIFIYDWKTGKGEGELHALQLACYRIYAERKWQPQGSVHTFEFNLARNAEKEYVEENFSSVEALFQIEQSIKVMKDKLVDVANNQAVEEDFSFTTETSKCQFCNFKRICPSQL